jgi:hypothetical protein
VSEFANRWEEWEQTVRKPAERAQSEGRRRLDCGAALAEYEIRPLPDGRFVVRLTCRMEFGSGMSCPWRVFPTREEAVGFFREQALGFFQREGKLRKDREQARRKIIGLLQGDGLFGFEEPEPETLTPDKE